MDREEFEWALQESLGQFGEFVNELNQIENVTYIPNVKRIADFKKACVILQRIFKKQIQNQELELKCIAGSDPHMGTLTPLFPGYGRITIIGNFELQDGACTEFANAISTATSWSLDESNRPGKASMTIEWDQLFETILPNEDQNQDANPD